MFISKWTSAEKLDENEKDKNFDMNEQLINKKIKFMNE